MKFKILLLISGLRVTILKKILYLSGFKIIRDHWLYVKEIKTESVIIDLGSNTGTFSEAMVRSFGSKCYAIEPNVELFKNLDDKIFKKMNLAVTKNDGPIDFYISDNHEASSLSKNFQSLWNVVEKQTVEGISWDSLLKKLYLTNSKIEVLKIDIEGGELDLIDSFNDQNTINIQQITIEFHHRLNPALHERTKQSIKKLLSYGYIGVANSISPTEILFIREQNYKFKTYQKILMKVYNKFRFSIY